MHVVKSPCIGHSRADLLMRMLPGTVRVADIPSKIVNGLGGHVVRSGGVGPERILPLGF